MRTRTIFAVLLVLTGLIAFGPALIAVGSQEIAEKALGFLIWYSYLSRPAGGVLFVIWAVAALIAFIVGRHKRRSEQT
jgi:TRAP-type C4-dicarboxylate transport system permease small subunit